MQTLRLANLYALAAGRHPNGLPDDEIGRAFLRIILNYQANARDPVATMTDTAARWARWLDNDELAALIEEAVT